MTFEEMKVKFAEGLEMPTDSVMLALDTEYPDCLIGVIVGDCDPSKMSDTIRSLEGGLFRRTCINVCESDLAYRFAGLDVPQAFELSWDCAIATIRFE